MEQSQDSQSTPAENADNVQESARVYVPLSLVPGQLVADRYRIIALIGQGGMGSVYRVEDTLLHKEFALKTLNYGNVSKTVWRRFSKEARAAGLLDHATLCKVHAVGVIDANHPYYVMDYFEGETLAELIKRGGALPLDLVLRIFLPACYGLAYAHENRVIHRDIKPSNIMLSKSDKSSERHIKIVDFGIAKVMGGTESEALTRTGEIFGTPYYMSPEQCLGAGIDHRTDIYSFGCVMFEALTGAVPFLAENALSTMMKHQSEKPPSLREASLGKTFPDAVQKVIDKLLEKDPNQRYQNFYAVADDLNRIKQGLSVNLYKEESVPMRLERQGRRLEYAVMLAIMALSFGIGFLAYPKLIGIFARDKPMPVISDFQSLPAYQPTEGGSAGKVEDNTSPAGTTTSGLHHTAQKEKPLYFSTNTGAWSNVRMFHFPKDVMIGTLVIRGLGHGYIDTDAGLVPCRPGAQIQARGSVLIEDFDGFDFTAYAVGFKNPEFFSRFRPDEITALKLYEKEVESASDEELRNITNLTSICELDVTQNERITDKVIPYFNQLPKLNQLRINNTRITVDGLCELKRLRNLYFLEAENLQNVHKLLRAMQGSVELNRLSLRKVRLTDDDLILISSCPLLCALNISGDSSFSRLGINALTQLHHLRELNLNDTTISQSCVAPLKVLHDRNVKLSISAGSIKHLAKPDQIQLQEICTLLQPKGMQAIQVEFSE